MTTNDFFNIFLFFLFSLLAMILQLWAPSNWLGYFWPSWLLMVVLYWSKFRNCKGVLELSFVLGVINDALMQQTIGVSAVVYTLAAAAVLLNKRYINWAWWNRIAFWCLIFFGVKCVEIAMLAVTDDLSYRWTLWLNCLGNILLWPFIQKGLKQIVRPKAKSSIFSR